MFRKGYVLLGPNEMEGEYAGEDLRIEVGLLLKGCSCLPSKLNYHPAS